MWTRLITCLDSFDMETTPSSPASPRSEGIAPVPESVDASQLQQSADSQENNDISPVVFVPFDTLPNCKKVVVPTEIMNLEYFDLVYYKPSRSDSNGFYEFISPDKPDQKITLYQSGLRSVIKNLPLAFTAAKSLETHPHLQNDDSTYEVGIINTFNGMSTRLVVNTFQGEIAIYLKLFTSNEDGRVFPTRKSVQFSVKDNVAALSAFIKNKK